MNFKKIKQYRTYMKGRKIIPSLNMDMYGFGKTFRTIHNIFCLYVNLICADYLLSAYGISFRTIGDYCAMLLFFVKRKKLVPIIFILLLSYRDFVCEFFG